MKPPELVGQGGVPGFDSAYLPQPAGDEAGQTREVQPVKHFGRAILVGLTVTAGFVILFGIVGAIIGLGASFIGDLLQWLGLVIGIGLALVGAWMVGGGKLYFFRHRLDWWHRFADDCDVEVRPFNPISARQAKVLLPHDALGRLFFGCCDRLERRFPRLATRLWSYPLIILKKRQPSSADRARSHGERRS